MLDVSGVMYVMMSPHIRTGGRSFRACATRQVSSLPVGHKRVRTH